MATWASKEHADKELKETMSGFISAYGQIENMLKRDRESNTKKKEEYAEKRMQLFQTECDTISQYSHKEAYFQGQIDMANDYLKRLAVLKGQMPK